ncbi:MAG: AAA family ATPase [Saprospiraceae bacterium]
MEKRFNITGTCFPERHYMADVSAKFNTALRLVMNGEYFAINRPRQYGKTTMLEALSRELSKSDEWLVFKISFEGIGSTPFENAPAFCGTFLRLLETQMKNWHHDDLAAFLKNESGHVKTMEELSASVTAFAHETGRKLVLLIDEVDKSSNSQIFLDFLGMLRNKFLNRHEWTDHTFHSVVLAGLHDVKSLKSKIRPDEDAKYNSPWNIASDFDVDMSLQPHEIVPMLEDYSQERGVKMDAPAIADALFFYTSGYPFLVSALCKITDEKLLPEKTEQTWTLEDIETAANRLVKSERSNTNFDSLIKNLENDPDLYDLTFRLVIDNEAFSFNVHDPLIYKGIQHGIFRNGGRLHIHNQIYFEIISNYMVSKLLTQGKSLDLQTADPYLMPGNVLNFEKVLLKFQQLLREEYSRKDKDFLERYGRLLFLAFLKPILNAKGYTFKEPEISEERRLDIAVTFYQHKYVVELKIWRGEEAHQRGIAQLAAYLDRQHLAEGYLVIFDRRGDKTWKHEWITIEGKQVFAVWV